VQHRQQHDSDRLSEVEGPRRLRDLVDVPGGRQTRAEIEELGDPAIRR
jgi:hypothetical protein